MNRLEWRKTASKDQTLIVGMSSINTHQTVGIERIVTENSKIRDGNVEKSPSLVQVDRFNNKKERVMTARRKKRNMHRTWKDYDIIKFVFVSPNPELNQIFHFACEYPLLKTRVHLRYGSCEQHNRHRCPWVFPSQPAWTLPASVKKTNKKRNLPLMRGNINFIDLEVNTDFSEWWTSLSWD